MLAGPVVWALLVGFGIPRQSGWPSAKTFLMIVVVAPVLEEIVFRGGLQAWLFERPVFADGLGLQISFANVITSFIFASFHAFSQPMLWAAAIIFPSLIFGWARDKTDSVLPGMALHAWYNLGFVLLFVR